MGKEEKRGAKTAAALRGQIPKGSGRKYDFQLPLAPDQ